MAAEGCGKKEIYTKGTVDGQRRIRLPEVIVFLRNSVRPRKEFLISAVKLQLSIASQMCPLNSLLLRQNAEDGKLIKTS